MRSHFFVFAVAAVMGAVSAIASDVAELPADEPTEVGGIKLACTGIGDDAKHDPRWRTYAMRMEFANAAAEYVSDVVVSVAKPGGETLFTVHCDSPWVLADLEAGEYELAATFDGQKKAQTFKAPKTGQTRLVVRFR